MISMQYEELVNGLGENWIDLVPTLTILVPV